MIQRFKQFTPVALIFLLGGSLGYMARMQQAVSQPQTPAPIYTSEQSVQPPKSSSTPSHVEATSIAQSPEQQVQAPEPEMLQIIPGDHVGGVTRQTNRAELVKLYGDQNLTDQIISGPEGIGRIPVTKVDLGSARSFTVVWKDETQTEAIAVRDLGRGWQTPEGLAVGLSLDQLQQILGEFQVYGLAWDYGGTVILENTRLSQYQGKLILQVDAAPDAPQRFPDDFLAVSGDAQFSSTNPHWKPLGVKVQSITVNLE